MAVAKWFRAKSMRTQLLLSFGLMVTLVIGAFIGIWAGSVFWLKDTLIRDSKRFLVEQISLIAFRFISEVLSALLCPRFFAGYTLCSRTAHRSSDMPTARDVASDSPSLSLTQCDRTHRSRMFCSQKSTCRLRPSSIPSPSASSMRMIPSKRCLSFRSRVTQVPAWQVAGA